MDESEGSGLIGENETVIESFRADTEDEETDLFSVTDRRFIRVKGDDPQKIRSINYGSPEVYGVRIEKESGTKGDLFAVLLGLVLGLIGIGAAAAGGELFTSLGVLLIVIGVVVFIVGMLQEDEGAHEVTFLLAEPDNETFSLPEGAEALVDAVHRRVGANPNFLRK